MSFDRPGFVENNGIVLHRFIYGNGGSRGMEHGWMEGVVKVARPSLARSVLRCVLPAFHSFIPPFGISDARATNGYDGNVLYRVINASLFIPTIWTRLHQERRASRIILGGPRALRTNHRVGVVRYFWPNCEGRQ